MGIDNAVQLPVNVVGSSVFGRYPKISVEKTYNMFISDSWLVNYAGFQKRAVITNTGEGRGAFHSIRGNFMLCVIASGVYKFGTNLAPQFVGTLDSSFGEVSMDENLDSQICIADGQDAYIYNYDSNQLVKQNLTFLAAPIAVNYVCYHNTFFLIASRQGSDNSFNWYAFEKDTDTTLQLNTQFSLQTKADSAIAVRRLPGRGNNVIVFGTSVAEMWTQVGGTDNYRRIQSSNIDYGTVSVNTIDANEEFICWIAQNESSSPCLYYSNGSEAQRISTDGIDYLLQSIEHPEQSTAFFFRQDGHLFYQFTFFNPDDNLSMVYDFNTQKFYHVSDQDQNFHPARQIVYFNKATYFVSINDAAIYEMSTNFISYNYNLDENEDGDVIPRIRIPKTLRKEDSSRWRGGSFTFWLEQGCDGNFIVDPNLIVCDGSLITESGGFFIVTEQGDTILSETGSCFGSITGPVVDLSLSKNGNQSFGNYVRKYLNSQGNYRNIIKWWRMGQCNELTLQLRFYGLQRFVAGDGIFEAY